VTIFVATYFIVTTRLKM